MKKTSLYKMVKLVLVVGAAALWTLPANAAPQKVWPQPPNLAFQQCVAARQSVNRNPFSTSNNDFFVITTYEDNGKRGAFAGGRKGSSTGAPSPALSVYLVVRVSLAQNQPVPFVHDAALMVLEKNMVLHGSRKPITRRWILLDVNGDGTVDKLMFSQSVKTAEAQTHAVKIPAARMAELQAYYKKAVRILSKKAANPSADMCIPI